MQQLLQCAGFKPMVFVAHEMLSASGCMLVARRLATGIIGIANGWSFKK